MLPTKACRHVCILESDAIILNRFLFFLRGERRVLHLSMPPPHTHSLTHIAVIAIIAVEAQPWLDNVVLKYHSNLMFKNPFPYSNWYCHQMFCLSVFFSTQKNKLGILDVRITRGIQKLVPLSCFSFRLCFRFKLLNYWNSHFYGPQALYTHH